MRFARGGGPAPRRSTIPERRARPGRRTAWLGEDEPSGAHRTVPGDEPEVFGQLGWRCGRRSGRSGTSARPHAQRRDAAVPRIADVLFARCGIRQELVRQRRTVWFSLLGGGRDPHSSSSPVTISRSYRRRSPAPCVCKAGRVHEDRHGFGADARRFRVAVRRRRRPGGATRANPVAKPIAVHRPRSGAGGGNRTRTRSLGSFQATTTSRPPGGLSSAGAGVLSPPRRTPAYAPAALTCERPRGSLPAGARTACGRRLSSRAGRAAGTRSPWRPLGSAWRDRPERWPWPLRPGR